MTKVNTSAEHRSEYRKLLLAKRSELLSGWRTRFDPPAERGRVAEDDRAPIFHEEFISARINRLDARQIELIDAALDRLETTASAWNAVVPFLRNAWPRFRGRVTASFARTGSPRAVTQVNPGSAVRLLVSPLTPCSAGHNRDLSNPKIGGTIGRRNSSKRRRSRTPQ